MMAMGAVVDSPVPLPGPVGEGVDVLFIAGEHSGDQHASLLAGDILEQHPDWRLAAVGGSGLEQAGAQLLFDLTRYSVVGLVEVLRHYRFFKELFKALLEWIERVRPRAVVLVDYPGFNLRLAKALAAKGISRKGGGDVVVYQYVSPQIWAWKGKRRFSMARTLDELGVIFPFEKACYADTELPVRFVGHPFVRDGYRNPVRYDPDGPLLLLPGSRKQAVGRIFPVLLETLGRLRAEGYQRPCLCLYPDEAIHGLLSDLVGKTGLEGNALSFRHVDKGCEAGVVLTSSGTMSLNCALAGIPGAIVYRAQGVTAWIGKRLIRIQWLGIANLILGRTMYPEFLQQAARPEALAQVVLEYTANPELRKPFAKAAWELRARLDADQADSVPGRLVALLDAKR